MGPSVSQGQTEVVEAAFGSEADVHSRFNRIFIVRWQTPCSRKRSIPRYAFGAIMKFIANEITRLARALS